MKLIKFTVSLAFLLSAASLGGSVFLFQRYHAEQTLRENLELEKVQLKEQNASLESRLAQLESEQERLLGQVKDYANQRETLKNELDRAHQEAGDFKKQIKELESEKDALVQRLNLGEATDKAVVQEANRLPVVPLVPQKALTPPPPPVPAPAKPVETKKPKKPAKKKGEKKAEEKPEQKVAKKAEKKVEAPPPKPVVDQRPTQVLSVNRKFNFVVVNVGLRNSIKIGDTLRVEQNGKLVGRVEVEKLYEHFSACAIVEETKPGTIQEGDLVRIA